MTVNGGDKFGTKGDFVLPSVTGKKAIAAGVSLS
jgi:hypothetical protein